MTSTDPGAVQESAWKAGFWPMVMVQAALSASFTIFVPILPLYLPETGVRSFHDLSLWAGWLNGVTPLVAVFTAPLWGRLADHWGRRKVIVANSLGLAACAALMGTLPNPWFLLLLRAGMGVFSGFAPAGIALVASRAPPGRLGFALGWLATGQIVGTLVGPLVGGLITTFAGPRPTFGLTGVMLMGVGALAYLTLKEAGPPEHAASHPRPRFRDGLRSIAASPVLMVLVGVMLTVQMSIRGVQPIITLVVQRMVDPAAPVALLAGLAFSMTGFGDIIAAPFLGRRSDVLGYRRVLLISMVGVAAFTALQGAAAGYPLLLFGRFCAGMFVGGILPTVNALIGRATPERERGMIYGVTSSASFLGSFMGPIAGGAASAALGFGAVFYGSAGLLLAAALLVAVVVPPHERWMQKRSID